ncbi:hypothetical protein MTR_4g129450 [Medicago truncatula]|uniref:Uncharacterized protein n=1 Tax=Medicago truncatula TaxID=3880 RepID=G7JEB8_MEDTR|nr:hypothetical protein MTR_4g129450 [Medicago truncatula]
MTESLKKGTFVREFARGRSTGKSARRKYFVRGYTPGKKRGAQPLSALTDALID